jgi:nucleotidyltransferase substrate binding protein (TIGR01987 family)
MTTEDIRWKQRFNNFVRAFRRLDEGIRLKKERELSNLEQQGLIQAFEFTHELAWNVLKDYLEEQGITGLIGSKDSTRMAFNRGLIENGDAWMEMIKSRNLTSHAYDEQVADQIAMEISDRFYPCFEQFSKTFTLLFDQPA